MVTKNKSSKAQKAVQKSIAKQIPQNSCLCGCGAKVKGTFKQGHDARLHGQLLRGEVKSPNAEQKAFAKSHKIVIGSKKAKKAA